MYIDFFMSWACYNGFLFNPSVNTNPSMNFPLFIHCEYNCQWIFLYSISECDYLSMNFPLFNQWIQLSMNCPLFIQWIQLSMTFSFIPSVNTIINDFSFILSVNTIIYEFSFIPSVNTIINASFVLLNLTWTPDLSNPKSAAFRSIAEPFCQYVSVILQ